MTARLLDSRGVGHPCEVLDLSLGGAAICFPAVKAPAICRGQEVLLEFKSMARETDVRAKAKIVVVVADSVRVRCGMVFSETGTLLEQLDAYHARLFNRRRFPRVLPDLRTKLALTMTWEDGVLEARAHDISAGGLGLGLSREAANELAGIEFVQVRFTIPGTTDEGTVRDVRVVVGAASRVEVSCDDNLLEHVRTRVVDGELVIDTDGESLAFRQSVRIEIGCAALEGATLSGSGALRIEGLKGQRFEASLSGSGDLSARGQTERAPLSLTGSGELDCRELVAEEAQVSLAGSGDVRVHARARLSVSVSGSGDVRYSGAPAQVTRSVAGSGTIAPE